MIINWDDVFGWRIWQIIKWVWLFSISGLLVLLIHYNYTRAKENKQDRDSLIAIIDKVLYDTNADDRTLIQLLKNYREGKHVPTNPD